MAVDPEPRAAPDLFAALELEPLATRVSEVPSVDQALTVESLVHAMASAPKQTGVPELVEDEPSDETTAPLVDDADVVAIEEDAAKDAASFPGLAELLEPPRNTRVVSSASSTTLPPASEIDVAVGSAPRSFPWGWAAMVTMLGGALFYVLYTQTDLLQGDVIARRDAQAAAKAQSQLVQAVTGPAAVREYGQIEFNSTPEGARVWLMKQGPEATFRNLPRGNEYQVIVEAPGHATRVKELKGSELGVPIVVDLDAIAPDQAVEVPELEPPNVDGTASATDTVDLVLRSNTEGARLGLLVGFTPGVKLVDVNVSEVHAFKFSKSGYESHEVTVKGRHFEEMPGGDLVYMDAVVLVAATPLQANGPAEDVSGMADEEVMEIEDDEPVAKPVKKTVRSKKRKARAKRKRR